MIEVTKDNLEAIIEEQIKTILLPSETKIYDLAILYRTIKNGKKSEYKITRPDPLILKVFSNNIKK
jgi:hypothetical protein